MVWKWHCYAWNAPATVRQERTHLQQYVCREQVDLSRYTTIVEFILSRVLHMAKSATWYAENGASWNECVFTVQPQLTRDDCTVERKNNSNVVFYLRKITVHNKVYVHTAVLVVERTAFQTEFYFRYIMVIFHLFWKTFKEDRDEMALLILKWEKRSLYFDTFLFLMEKRWTSLNIQLTSVF